MHYWKFLTVISMVATGITLVDNPAQAQTPTGTWNLARVNGQPLPVVTETTTNCEEAVLSGTLTLESNGEWRFNYAERDTCANNVEEDQEEEAGKFMANGQQVDFSDDTDAYDPNDLDIDEFGSGTVSGDELSITLQDGRTTLVFRH